MSNTARGCLRGFIGCLGALIIVVLLIVGGSGGPSSTSETSGDGSMYFVLAGFTLILTIVLCVVLGKAGRINMDSWIGSKNNCRYKHAFDGFGIAVDTDQAMLYVTSPKEGPHSYPFSSVREWGYDIPGYDSTVIVGRGGGVGMAGARMGAATQNILNAAKAEDQTGFWVRVKDIDYPEWFIRFQKSKNVETELKRWMEIFQQYINEEQNQQQSYDSEPQRSGNSYCIFCGAKIIENNNFCINCGKPV
jgi:hypothetical protein